jgi:GxxExxY protein
MGTKPEYLYSEITETVIGCAMKVHRALGKGFPENIYQRALSIELNKSSLKIHEQASCPVYYDDQLIGKRIVDFMIDEKVLVEIKATSVYEPSHLNQIINYLHAFNLPIGLLLNFGKDSLEFKRFTNNQYKSNII